jgi:hypothetical protein
VVHPDRAQPDESARQAWFQTLASLAQAETQLGRRPQAIAACQRARDLVLGLLPAHPRTPAQHVQFAGLATHRGFVMQGDLPAEARVWLQQACAAYEATQSQGAKTRNLLAYNTLPKRHRFARGLLPAPIFAEKRGIPGAKPVVSR